MAAKGAELKIELNVTETKIGVFILKLITEETWSSRVESKYAFS